MVVILEALVQAVAGARTVGHSDRKHRSLTKAIAVSAPFIVLAFTYLLSH
jgi:hypothetical protein